MKYLLPYALVVIGSLFGAELPQGTWSKPVQLTEGAAERIFSAVDAEGNVVALCLQGTSLQASTCPLGGSWTSSSCLTSQAKGAAVAVDNQGNAMALWNEEAYGNFSICAAVLPKGSTEWNSLGAITTQAGRSLTEYSFIGFTEDGTALAGWINHTQDHSYYQVARLNSGSSQWNFVQELTLPPGFLNPVIALSKGGRALLAWQEQSGYLTIQAVTLENNASTWSSVQVVSPPHSVYPQVALDRAGNALLLWATIHQKSNVGAAYLPVGSQEWEALPPPHGFYQLPLLQIGMNDTQEAVVFHATSNAAQVAQFYPTTKTWSKTKNLEISPGQYPCLIEGSLSLDPQGNALALWIRNLDPSGVYLMIATRPQGGTWSKPLRLPRAVPHTSPVIPLLGPHGNATVLYLNNKKTNVAAVQGTGLFP